MKTMFFADVAGEESFTIDGELDPGIKVAPARDDSALDVVDVAIDLNSMETLWEIHRGEDPRAMAALSAARAPLVDAFLGHIFPAVAA